MAVKELKTVLMWLSLSQLRSAAWAQARSRQRAGGLSGWYNKTREGQVGGVCQGTTVTQRG